MEKNFMSVHLPVYHFIDFRRPFFAWQKTQSEITFFSLVYRTKEGVQCSFDSTHRVDGR